MIDIDRAIQLLDLGYTLDQVRAVTSDTNTTTVTIHDNQTQEEPVPEPVPEPDPVPTPEQEQIAKLNANVEKLSKALQLMAVRGISTPTQQHVQTAEEVLASFLQPKKEDN